MHTGKWDRKISKVKKKYHEALSSGKTGKGTYHPGKASEADSGKGDFGNNDSGRGNAVKSDGNLVRLNKFLSDSGICSRRQADRYVEEGRIRVDGETAVLGQKISPGQEVLLDGEPVMKKPGKVTLALNKPKGIVCTTEEREKDNIINYLQFPQRVYPVGRLDKDSEGLILLTNDGDLMNEILRARNYHEKEYLVEVNRPVTAHFLKEMSEGVEILDTKTRPCKVSKTGLKSFRIVLTQGLNRQIRRMCEALGYRVVSLKRIRVMNVELRDLKVGDFREIRGEELYELYHRTGLKPPGRLPHEAPRGDQPILRA